MILLLRVRGNSGTKWTPAGRSGLPSWAATVSATVVPEVAAGSCAGTAKTTTDSPLISSGTPMAAASATAGCVTAADSTSAGPIRLPAIKSVSSERPWMYHEPSSSISAQSPCTHTSGQRDQYVSK